MRRLFLAAAFAAISTASLAAGWQSGMVEDEGGPVMQAWVDGDGGDVPPELRLMCGDQINVRYSFGSGPGEEGREYPDPLKFDFDFGTETKTLTMQYEEMDGAFAAYIDTKDPFVALLKSGTGVRVSDPTGTWHDQLFPLQGSSKAVDAVLKSCN
ncbi:MAG: hypothetical protein ABIQ30_02510 [Devosia sp.]